MAEDKGIRLFGANPDHARTMEGAGLDVFGDLDDLLAQVDVVVDCTPKGVGAENAGRYRDAGIGFVVQGGEKHEVTGHSFVAESNYGDAVGPESTRVVSCNTTSIVRMLTALKRADLLGRARGALLRRATDPWKSDLGGIMNTVVPESRIPSHQAPDARTVDPDLDVVTMAVKVPETLGHVHLWTVRLARGADGDDVLRALAGSTRIARVRIGHGLRGINVIKELALDLGRPRADVYEVVVWEDLVTVDRDELHYGYMVDNQAVIPETIDAVRALSGREPDAEASIRTIDDALGIRSGPWGRKPETVRGGSPAAFAA